MYYILKSNYREGKGLSLNRSSPIGVELFTIRIRVTRVGKRYGPRTHRKPMAGGLMTGEKPR
jgi:hypothetical protein